MVVACLYNGKCFVEICAKYGMLKVLMDDGRN